MIDRIEISTDPRRMDVDCVHGFLSNHSHWARGRTRDVVETCIANSLCFGAFSAEKQVGFCRVVTDYAVYGYLLDMFVLPEWRGRGIARLLMTAVVDHPDIARLEALQLRSRDAGALYAKFGFKVAVRPDEILVRYRSP